MSTIPTASPPKSPPVAASSNPRRGQKREVTVSGILEIFDTDEPSHPQTPRLTPPPAQPGASANKQGPLMDSSTVHTMMDLIHLPDASATVDPRQMSTADVRLQSLFFGRSSVTTNSWATSMTGSIGDPKLFQSNTSWSKSSGDGNQSTSTMEMHRSFEDCMDRGLPIISFYAPQLTLPGDATAIDANEIDEALHFNSSNGRVRDDAPDSSKDAEDRNIGNEAAAQGMVDLLKQDSAESSSAPRQPGNSDTDKEEAFAVDPRLQILLHLIEKHHQEESGALSPAIQQK